ncbi:MAG: GNAT family N-acetyltransferase [Alphaproteobacteria bacterium]|nr:GNAT family N-acetyltransferase [Alphaproteobacteria bacterium]
MKVVHLIDVPEVIPEIARLFIEEWGLWYGPDGPGDAESDLRKCNSRNTLPLCLVALDDQGKFLGTAALKGRSVGDDLAPGPWLAAMLVVGKHRGAGVGTALVRAIEKEALQLGLRTIYTSTDVADTIMVRHGWRLIGESESLRGTARVYRRDLGEEC